MPPVLTRASVVGEEGSRALFDRPTGSMRGGSPARSTEEEVADEKGSFTITATQETIVEEELIEEWIRLHEAAWTHRRPRRSARRARRRVHDAGAAGAADAERDRRRSPSATRTAAASATASARSRSAPRRPRRRRSAGQDRRPLINVIHRNTDAAGQLSDLRTLISQKVNAIVFNPNDPDALNPALAEAHAAGIVTVSVDAYVTDPNTWNLYNNQVKYAYLGATWLFKQMGGKGTVWYTRGLAGNPADSDRDIGFNQALKENPGITVSNPGGTFTGWDPARRPRSPTTSSPAAATTRSRASGHPAWAPRSSTRSRPPTSRSCRSLTRTSARSSASCSIPTGYPGPRRRGGDQHRRRRRRRRQPGLQAAVRHDRRAVGGAGRPNTVLLDPQILDNTTDQGKADLKAWISVPGLDPLWPLSLSIPGWTDYDPNAVPASCNGRIGSNSSSTGRWTPARRLHRPLQFERGRDDPHRH